MMACVSDKTVPAKDIRGDKVEKSSTSTALNSVYLSEAHQVVAKLNAVSPCLCLAKWFHVSLHLTTGKTHSCYHPPAHSVPLEELSKDPSALHNTVHKKAQRAQMLAGERPKECQYCWNIEDSDGGGKHLSDRAYRSQDVFTESAIDDVLRLGATENPLPRYVEVNFNQACNFKCSYCSPHLSSEWAKEARELGAFRLKEGTHNDTAALAAQGMMPIPVVGNPYVEAFWKWWPELYKELRNFRMTGGEPLIDKNTYRVFDYIIENPKKELLLAITSNCCPPADTWQQFITKLKRLVSTHSLDHFQLYCSLDSWGPQAEYIRFGMNFDRLYQNVCQFLGEIERHSLTFIVTFNNLSVPGWRSYLQGILDLRSRFSIDRQLIWFDTPMLRFPAWQSLQILPSRYREILKADLAFMEENAETSQTRFKGFKDFEIARMRRVIAWMEEPLSESRLQNDRANFYIFFKQHDLRRKTSFEKTFPEMSDFWEMCREAAFRLGVEERAHDAVQI
jgi:hypothetical protein